MAPRASRLIGILIAVKMIIPLVVHNTLNSLFDRLLDGTFQTEQAG